MKKILMTLMLAVAALTVTAQTDKRINIWLTKGEWRNGFTKANPHKTLNCSEFYRQYKKNTEQWNTLFKWLAETDLEAIPKGKRPIPGSTLTASVEDSEMLHWRSAPLKATRKRLTFNWW